MCSALGVYVYPDPRIYEASCSYICVAYYYVCVLILVPHTSKYLVCVLILVDM